MKIFNDYLCRQLKGGGMEIYMKNLTLKLEDKIFKQTLPIAIYAVVENDTGILQFIENKEAGVVHVVSKIYKQFGSDSPFNEDDFTMSCMQIGGIRIITLNINKRITDVKRVFILFQVMGKRLICKKYYFISETLQGNIECKYVLENGKAIICEPDRELNDFVDELYTVANHYIDHIDTYIVS